MKKAYAHLKNWDRDIEEIIKEFDFHKVHKAMKALNWEYAGTKGVPTVKELKDTARGLLNEAVERCVVYTSYHMNEIKTYGEVSTGGFTATVDHKGLRLQFVLEQWETWYDR